MGYCFPDQSHDNPLTAILQRRPKQWRHLQAAGLVDHSLRARSRKMTPNLGVRRVP